MSAAPVSPTNPTRTYHVFVGIFGLSNPGEHAIGHVVVSDGQRHEWATSIGHTTSPAAWKTAVDEVRRRVNRPGCIVVVHVRDKYLGGLGTDTFRVEWTPKAEGNVEMERAHVLAGACLGVQL